jgi:hypothetical protein
MSKYLIQVTFKISSGTSSSNLEVNLPDHLDSKIGNSSFKQEVINALNAVLPDRIGGRDWRKEGQYVESFNNVRKL